ncbi:hypothetical protein Nisw_06595 [Candidatus Nitrosopumilus sp. SW]|uniref:5' nucleotidase, NT5C type n=1 Tax=Candidatus Nitrosopumilus sp. SW TaxID=2508726 RepID=UPI001151AE28|nr:hypothetical protein [Candidatus Nitrosopumilus sp. SW]QDI89213.1 hypothetical protein Nisw_06595 [Candidatus Nitrosopumilus sp. SW]
MRIGIDIDGVISDFVTSFRKLVKEEYGVDFGYEDIQQHDLWKVLGLPKDETLQLVIKTFEYDLGVQPGAIEGLKALAKKHEIILVTARPVQAKQKTLEWLEKNDVSYQKIIFTNEGNKHCVEEENLEVIIDDHLEEISNWIGKTQKILVFNHPWNKSLNIKNHFRRVYSWENILEELN